MKLARPNPTEGLSKAERLALCDATYGLLGRIGDHYQRATSAADFKHSPATIAALVARGLLIMLDGEFAQPSFKGRQCATRLRARREAIRKFDQVEAMRQGVLAQVAWGERGGCAK